MPANVSAEYANAQKKYLEARGREEKIAALEEMISTIPKHKGTERMQADLKSRLAKLRKQSGAKAGHGAISIPKEGDAQIAIIGLTQSGKSTLLATLTNARPAISPRRFTTIKPEIGVAEWRGVKIQMIEMPSTWQPAFMSIASNADGVLLVLDPDSDMDEQREQLHGLLEKFKIRRHIVEIIGKSPIDTEQLMARIWRSLRLVRVYTKEPGKPKQHRALVLKGNATVADAANRLHKDFIKFFRFARVWGTSSKYKGERVGLDHKLADGDIVEIHTSA